MKQLFEKFRTDSEFYEDEFLNYYEGPEEQAKHWFNHYFDMFLENLSKVSISENGVLVWRSVALNSLESINLQKIGSSWSYKKDAAHAWYGGSGETYLIEAYIKTDSINIETTLRQNLVNPDEFEFRLLNDEEVIVLKIYDKDNKEIKNFKNGYKSLSGKIGLFGNYSD